MTGARTEPQAAAHATDMTPAAGDGRGPASGGVLVEGAFKDFTDPHGHLLDVLEDVDLEVAPGEFVAIVGPSGCGKTTLLRAIQGLERLSAGTVAVAGCPPGEIATGFVFQRASLLPWKTVARNVSFGLDLRVARSAGGGASDKAVRQRRVAELLELTGLADFADFYPAQLSGGMQQRVNLARALAIDPVVLLMDEPFSALDAQTREKLQRDLQRIVASAGTTTVFVTHDIREAAFQADRVVLMSSRPGRIARVFTIDEPRPRSAEFQQSDRLAEIARDIWAELHGRKQGEGGASR
jgi:ABC-type nitrate/sulfonate/bicarbonate transport system ATPase subunit